MAGGAGDQDRVIKDQLVSATMLPQITVGINTGCSEQWLVNQSVWTRSQLRLAK